MNTEESLLAILKQNKKIFFGQTLGTNSDGNCLVQTDGESVIARSAGDVPAGDCVALKVDDGQWYAISAVQTGVVQKKELFSRRNKADQNSIEIRFALLTQDTTTGSIGVVLGNEFTDLGVPVVGGSIIGGGIELGENGDRILLAITKDRDLHIISYLNRQIEGITVASNIVPEREDDIFTYYDDSDRVHTRTRESVGVYVSNPVGNKLPSANYLWIDTIKLKSIETFGSGENDYFLGLHIGTQFAEVTNKTGFYDVLEGSRNFTYSTASISQSHEVETEIVGGSSVLKREDYFSSIDLPSPQSLLGGNIPAQAQLQFQSSGAGDGKGFYFIGSGITKKVFSMSINRNNFLLFDGQNSSTGDGFLVYLSGLAIDPSDDFLQPPASFSPPPDGTTEIYFYQMDNDNPMTFILGVNFEANSVYYTKRIAGNPVADSFETLEVDFPTSSTGFAILDAYLIAD